MRKRLLLASLASLICGAGCPSASPPPSASLPQADVVQTAVGGLATTSGAVFSAQVNGASTDQTASPRYSIRTAEIKESSNLYEATAKFPEISGLADTATQAAFNSKIREDAAAGIKEFAGYFEDVDREEFLKAFRCFYEMDYRTVAHGRYLSVVMEGSEFAGGAHPAAIYRTYVFDTEAGGFLTLGDLFKPGSDFLTEISSSTLAAIAKLDIGDADWNKSGTSPQTDNFRLFWLAEDGLHILFPPYQVASYAEGPHEVTIPFRGLENLIPIG